MPQQLISMLQISDLHIGRIDPVSGDAQVSRAAALLFSNLSWFDGVLGHHARGLQDLAEFYWQMVDRGEAPHLIMTGDLTRVGHINSFQTAASYLSAEIDLNPPSNNYVGLNDQNWTNYAIPGNHDHWPGSPSVWGAPTAALNGTFNGLPFVRPPIKLLNGRELVLAGINTDIDVRPYGQKRLRAVGSFQTHLNALAPQLGKNSGNQIRVLLLHHSWHRRGLTLGIDRGSRTQLDRFLDSHGIQVVLTGHTHRALVQPFVPNVKGANPVLECRSGTTTQADEVPYSWRTLIGNSPVRNWPENTLIVHRVFDDNGVTEWHAEVFFRDTNQGFLTTGPKGQKTWKV